MKISRLLFECVKDSINLPHTSINEYGFLNGDFNNNKDYVNQIGGALSAINLAISRLQDSGKVPFATEEVEVNSGVIEFNKGQIVNVLKLNSTNFTRFPFRTLEHGRKYKVFGNYLPSKLLVEYRTKIPHFTENDIKKVEQIDGKIIDENIELENYGITDIMCDYIKEFVKGQLLEYIAPDLANLHNNRAEQYYQNLVNYTTSFYQSNVKNNHGGLF